MARSGKAAQSRVFSSLLVWRALNRRLVNLKHLSFSIRMLASPAFKSEKGRSDFLRAFAWLLLSRWLRPLRDEAAFCDRFNVSIIISSGAVAQKAVINHYHIRVMWGLVPWRRWLPQLLGEACEAKTASVGGGKKHNGYIRTSSYDHSAQNKSPI